MDNKAYSPKDAKIIRDNEGKTPYELLELGLSQKAFTRLTSDLAEQAAAPTASQVSASVQTAKNLAAQKNDEPAAGIMGGGIKPAITEVVPAKASMNIQPVITPLPTASNIKQKTVVGPTGIPQKVAAKQAEKLARNKDYQIIDNG